MALEISKTLGIPLVEGLSNASDLPHTVSLSVTYRTRINSFYELPEDKRPPRNLWDKPHRLSEFLDEVFKTNTQKNDVKTYVDYDIDEIE